ncbi:Poly(A) polymerase [Savitreella phatthalungensis]
MADETVTGTPTGTGASLEIVNGVLQQAPSEPTTGGNLSAVIAALREAKAAKAQEPSNSPQQRNDLTNNTDFISFGGPETGSEDGASEHGSDDNISQVSGESSDPDVNGDNDNEDDNDSISSASDGNAFAEVGHHLADFIQNVATVGKKPSTKRKRGQHIFLDDDAEESESGVSTSSKKRRGGSKHASTSTEPDLADKSPHPWLRGKHYANEDEPARILHRELSDFVNYLTPTADEMAMRTYVVDRIRRILKKRWPTASLHSFGSFATGLYLPTSDLDLVVLSKDSSDAYERVGHLRKLAGWLVSAGIAQDVQVISGARVPIIKFVDRSTRLNVDISFNKPGGLIAVEVVRDYMRRMPALKPLVLFIKHFLGMRGLNEVYLGGLGSYSIICLCISFLQQHPKLASGQIHQADNLGVLLLELLELYGKRFNYDKVGISVRGKGRYFDKYLGLPGSNGGSIYAGKQSYLLCIEDPTDTSNDIAKSSFGILKVKSTLAGCYDFLTQRIYDVNDRIKTSRRKNSSARIKAEVEDLAILSAVISVDVRMQRRRRELVRAAQELREKRDDRRDANDGEDSDEELEALRREDQELQLDRVPGLVQLLAAQSEQAPSLPPALIDIDALSSTNGAPPTAPRSQAAYIEDDSEDDSHGPSIHVNGAALPEQKPTNVKLTPRQQRKELRRQESQARKKRKLEERKARKKAIADRNRHASSDDDAADRANTQSEGEIVDDQGNTHGYVIDATGEDGEARRATVPIVIDSDRDDADNNSDDEQHVKGQTRQQRRQARKARRKDRQGQRSKTTSDADSRKSDLSDGEVPEVPDAAPKTATRSAADKRAFWANKGKSDASAIELDDD